jgi:hypothetical protein
VGGLRLAIAVFFLGTFAGGCSELKYDNTATTFDRPFLGDHDTLGRIWLKTCYLYPIRDYLTFIWAGRLLFGDEAWNAGPDGGVADGPFFTNRDIRSLSPLQVGIGPASAEAPLPPWRVKKPKESGGTPGFVGEDSSGRTFLVKFDQPDYPELGTSAEIIGSRIYWLMGYRVPATYLVNIEGTGQRDYDGRRATASLFVPGELVGGFKFDCHRMRREIRALRLVAAWLNDTDRTDNNTLVAVENGVAACYLVDFNSCLGSWNGRPKEGWRGWRYAWDVEYQLLTLLTLGALPRLPGPALLRSPAVGSFDLMTDGDPHAWRSQGPNTAFDRLTRADADWMARRMGAVSVEQLASIVAAAQMTNPDDADAVLRMLLARRRRIVQAWHLDALSACTGGS